MQLSTKRNLSGLGVAKSPACWKKRCGVHNNVTGNIRTIRHMDLPLKLATLHAHPRDKRITFRESDHFYTLMDIKQKPLDFSAIFPNGKIPSVSSIADAYFDHFDELKMAGILASHPELGSRPKWTKYRCCIVKNKVEETKQNILRLWDDIRTEASSKGTEMHSIIEHIYNDAPPLYTNSNTPELGFFASYKRLIEERGWRPYRTEWRLFSEFYAICGTIDMIFIDREGRLHMVDWKRSKEIKFRGYDKGRGICAGIENCNYTHYCLQLNTYKFLLEQYYNVRVVDMHLAVFHPNQRTYQIVDIPESYQPLVQSLLEKRRQFLDSKGYRRMEQPVETQFLTTRAEPCVIINHGYALGMNAEHSIEIQNAPDGHKGGITIPGSTPVDMRVEYFDGESNHVMSHIPHERKMDNDDTSVKKCVYGCSEQAVSATITYHIVQDLSLAKPSICITGVFCELRSE